MNVHHYRFVLPFLEAKGVFNGMSVNPSGQWRRLGRGNMKNFGLGIADGEFVGQGGEVRANLRTAEWETGYPAARTTWSRPPCLAVYNARSARSKKAV